MSMLYFIFVKRNVSFFDTLSWFLIFIVSASESEGDAFCVMRGTTMHGLHFELCWFLLEPSPKMVNVKDLVHLPAKNSLLSEPSRWYFFLYIKKWRNVREKFVGEVCLFLSMPPPQLISKGAGIIKLFINSREVVKYNRDCHFARLCFLLIRFTFNWTLNLLRTHHFNWAVKNTTLAKINFFLLIYISQNLYHRDDISLLFLLFFRFNLFFRNNFLLWDGKRVERMFGFENKQTNKFGGLFQSEILVRFRWPALTRVKFCESLSQKLNKLPLEDMVKTATVNIWSSLTERSQSQLRRSLRIAAANLYRYIFSVDSIKVLLLIRSFMIIYIYFWWDIKRILMNWRNLLFFAS